MSNDTEKKLLDWYAAGDTGASSEAMAAHLSGRKAARWSYPRDGGDLGRCLRLLKAVPELRNCLQDMIALDQYWAALIPRWVDLERLMTEECGEDFRRDKASPKTYKLLCSILDPVERADSSVVRMGPGVSLRFGR